MDNNVWSMPAMCMTPSAETIKQNKYVTTAGRVKFKVGESGKIVFLGAIQNSFPEGRYALRAHISRKTPNLFGTTILLRRARRVGGAVETVLSCSTVQTGSSSTNVRATDSQVKQMSIDLNEFYYWVQVTDVNTSPATNESVDSVLGVGLVQVQV